MSSISCPPGTEPQKKSQGSYFELACRRPDGVIDGAFTEWYSDGSPKTQGQYTHARPTGNWTLWQPGYKNAEGPVDGFRSGPRGDTALNESGLWIYWYPNGRKRSEGNIFNGKNEGRWTEWFNNGQKSAEGVYQNGQRDGVWIKWFRSGQKQEESLYSRGRKNGVSTVWQESGKLLSQAEYDHGRVSGTYTTWYGNGQKESEGAYISGTKDGTWTFWNTDGAIARVESWHGGNLEKTVQYENGKLVDRNR